MPLRFAVTYDYRCPFARIAHDHVIAGLRDGAEWDVSFVPLSLGQLHVAEGEPDVWDEPERDGGLLALAASVAVREGQAEHFLDVHHALFEARHAQGLRLRDEADIRKVLESVGADADAALDAIATGEPLAAVRAAHEAAVAEHEVWGVPTFIGRESAVFVRLMERPSGADDARRTIERVLDLVDGWPELNEFKHTSLRR